MWDWGICVGLKTVGGAFHCPQGPVGLGAAQPPRGHSIDPGEEKRAEVLLRLAVPPSRERTRFLAGASQHALSTQGGH